MSPGAALLAYAAIATFYVRQSRHRGVGTPIRPYVVAGVALAVLMTATSIWLTFHPLLPQPADPFSTDPVQNKDGSAVWLINGLAGPLAAIGLAPLVLAWVERRWALLAYTLVHLAIGIVQGDHIIHQHARGAAGAGANTGSAREPAPTGSHPGRAVSDQLLRAIVR